MSKSPTLFIIWLALSCTWSCAAGDTLTTESRETSSSAISFEEVLDHALLNSPNIRKSEVMMEIANQEWKNARGTFLPRLDLTSSTQNIEALGKLPGLESLLLSGRNNIYHSTSSIRLGLNAYNGGNDVAGLQLAAEKIQDAKLQWQLQRASVALVVLDHVHTVRQAEIELRIVQLQLELSAKQLVQAENSLSVGRISPLSYSEARYDLKSKELACTAKARAYQNALQNLSTAIGLESTASRWIKLSGERDEYDEVLVRRDFGSTSTDREIDIFESRIRQAQMEVKRARSGYLPQIDFFAKREYAAISESGFKQAFDNQRKDKNAFGFTLTWNLFDGLKTTAGVGMAAQHVISAEADRDIKMKEIQNKAADLASLLKDSEEELQVESQRLELLQMKLKISREKHDLGRSDALALSAAEMEFEVQKLALNRHAEEVAYHRAKLLLRQGRK